jgi:hypothetical protein
MNLPIILRASCRDWRIGDAPTVAHTRRLDHRALIFDGDVLDGVVGGTVRALQQHQRLVWRGHDYWVSACQMQRAP